MKNSEKSTIGITPNARSVEGARFVYVFNLPLVGIGSDLISTRISPTDQSTSNPRVTTESSVKSKGLKRDV